MSERILFDGSTALGRYQVIDMTYNGRRARVLFSGKKEAAFSGLALDENPLLLFDYNQRFRELVLHVRPKSLLLIGGGTYTLPMTLLSELSDIHIDAVEIDAGLEILAKEFFGLTDNPRLSIIHLDGRQFLETSDKRYDMILVDAFEDLIIPTKLSELSAIQRLHKRLFKTGTLAANIISSLKVNRTSILQQQAQTYSKVFPFVSTYPASHGYPHWLPQNYLLIASSVPQAEYGLRTKQVEPDTL